MNFEMVMLEGKELIEWCQSSGCYAVADIGQMRPNSLDPLVVDGDGKEEFTGDFTEEASLPAVTLDQVDMGIRVVYGEDCDYDPWKAGTRAHVDPDTGIGEEREDLGAIEDVPRPDC